MLSPAAASDVGVVAAVTDLINRVYSTAEAGLWVPGAARTSTSEVADLIAGDQIAVARVARQIRGSVRIQELDGVRGEFGMLVADPEYRGEGIGRELVKFAEDVIARRGLRVMQLEVLVPRNWSHPTKEFLHAWYTRIGYQPVHTGRIDEHYPHLASLLATPCDFVVYHKTLALGSTD